jgi:hypothetical protein
MPLTVVIRRRSPRRRRWPIYTVAILLAIGLSTPFWAVGVFRDDLIEVVSYRIDRPTEIETLSIQFRPRLALVADNVRIGHPEFNARADRVTIDINLKPLARRVVDIPSIRVDGLVWIVPERPGDLASEIAGLELQPGRGKGKWKSVVGRAYAEGARVLFAGQDDTVLIGNVAVRDLLEKEVTLTVDATAPIAGEAAALKGTVSFNKHPGSEPALAVEGSATLDNVDSRTFFDEEIVPNTQLDFASIKFERTGSNSVTVQLSGESYPASAEAAEAAALIGAFDATALWKDGRTDFQIHEWRAEGFELVGDITLEKDSSVKTTIAHCRANAEGIEAYFKLRPLADFIVRPTVDAELSVTNLRTNHTPDRTPSLLGGSFKFSGLNLFTDDGGQAFTGFSGNALIADDIITLNEISGDGLTIMGTVTPDHEAKTYRFALHGDAILSRERLDGFADIDRIREVAGQIKINNLEGTVKEGDGLPDDLVVEGELVDGRFRIESPAWSDTLENVALRFSTTSDQIETAGSAQSDMFGSVSADGTYFTMEDRWTGNVGGNFSSVALPSLQGTTQDVAMRILQNLGQSELDVDVVISDVEPEQVNIGITRLGAHPALTAKVDFAHTGETWTLADLAVTANLSSQVLTPLLPDRASTTGPMDVQFDRSAVDQRFRANLTLDAANIRLGEHLAKQPGAALAVSIDGRANADEWAAEVIDTTILSARVHGTLEQNRFNIETLDLDVAALAPLLREGGDASGRISGSIRTNPTDVSLNLQQVQVAFTDDLVANNINGALFVTESGIETDKLHVNAANSEFTLSLSEVNGRWQGGIAGSQVDANALMQFVEEYRALTDGEPLLTAAKPNDVESAGQSLLSLSEPKSDFSQPIIETSNIDTPTALTGEFNVAIDSLLYRNATLTNLRTRLVASDGNYVANDLSFVPYTGTASGNVRYSRNDLPYEYSAKADLVFDGIDAKIIDDLVFEESRKLKGTLSGDIMLDLPIGPDGAALDGINGRIKVSGKDGTLGSLGFANAILFVFKTTEILFLRSPFAESGLSYTELNGQANIVDGVVTLGVFENNAYTEAITLERPSYRMSAIGWVDLGKWDSEVVVHMQPLSSVADAARIFKIDEVEAINSRGGIRIYMSGPPDDPKTKIGFGGPVNAITNEIRSGVQSVQGLIKGQIIDGIGGLLRGLLER